MKSILKTSLVALSSGFALTAVVLFLLFSSKATIHRSIGSEA